jgi:NAD(P)-dependent dehydrogenase (short-subunit alcohol dehydrogenase family)
MTLLEGKVGLVTGAGSGLGRATALLAAAEGSRVVVADIDSEAGQETVRQISRAARSVGSAGSAVSPGSPGSAIFVHTDVANEAQVESMVARTVEEFGALDWASNNAVGGAASFGPLHQIEERGFTSTLDVCLKGVFFGMKYQIPAMLENGGGSIINITTAAVDKGEAMLAAYTAAKGGVEALTRTGAAEYSARGVRINAVAPGGFETPALARYFERYPEFRERTVNTHAMRRLGTPAEVAEPVIWLASDRASFVTGTTLHCDGGVGVNSHLL